MIADIREANVDLALQTTTLVMYAQQKGIVRGIFNPDSPLASYHVAMTGEIEAIEVLTKQGRERIRDNIKKNPRFLESQGTHLGCLTTKSEKSVEDPFRTSGSTNVTKSKIKKGLLKKDDRYGEKIDRHTLFNSYNVAFEKYQMFEDNLNFPEEIFAVAYHRRFVKKSHSFFCPY